jgi:hypothetical protein
MDQFSMELLFGFTKKFNFMNYYLTNESAYTIFQLTQPDKRLCIIE